MKLPNFTRRSFLKLPVIFSITTFFGCSSSNDEINQDVDNVVLKESFAYFINVLFPIQKLGFYDYQTKLMSRLKNLNSVDLKRVTEAYQLFKDKYEAEYGSLKFNNYTLRKGESVIIQLLQNSSSSKNLNPAMDIVYDEISKIKGLPDQLWNRKYSIIGRKCAYWENYDQPPKCVS
jgi:hypothetical protein